MEQLQQQVTLLGNKERFVSLVMKQKLPLFNRSREQLIGDMIAAKLAPMGKSGESPSFDYLTRMPLDAFSSEKLQTLKSDLKNKTKQFKTLQDTAPQTMWEDELVSLRESVPAKE